MSILKKTLTCAIGILLLFAYPAFADESSAVGETVDWQVLAGGGTPGSSSNYSVEHTIGQTAAGMGVSASYSVNQGFQQNFSAGYVCADADGNSVVSLGDAVYIINFIFGGGPPVVPEAAGDADCNGNISIGDAVYIINFIFGGGPSPCSACP